MFCNKCGSEIPADSKFCVKCGTKAETTQPVQQYVQTKTAGASDNSKQAKNSDGIAAIVFGILGLVGCMGFGIIFDIIAIILGIRGKKKAAEVGVGEGASIAGLILGIIGALIFIIMFLIQM